MVGYLSVRLTSLNVNQRLEQVVAVTRGSLVTLSTAFASIANAEFNCRTLLRISVFSFGTPCDLGTVAIYEIVLKPIMTP